MLAGSLFKPKVCLLITLFLNISLTVFKFFAGILGFSKAMIADALHSFSDVLTTIVAYVGVCIAERPADKDHPYGHGNAETIAAGLVSLAIIAVGVYAGLSSALALAQKSFKQPLAIALWAAAVSIVLKELQFRYTIKVGQISNNPAVIADAWHHRSDAFSSIAALIGIAGAKISFLFLDPLAGLLVSGFIVNIGLRLIRSNIGIMMDESPAADFLENIRNIAQEVSGVSSTDSVKVHRRGSTLTVDLEIAVDGQITVRQGHNIAAMVRNRLLEKGKNICEVMVHVNPVAKRPEGKKSA